MRHTRLALRNALGLCAALAVSMLSSAAIAQNYTVTMNPTLNGLDIKFNPVANSDMLIVNVTNNSDQRVRCDFNFDAPPQLPRMTSMCLRAGQTAPSVLQADRVWFSVTVNVTCVAV
jgi:hypothetical protein